MRMKEHHGEVIARELCHFRYRRHRDDFYKLLGKMMLYWQYRKHRLERVLLDR
jgi:predicted metal-dependent hydrolase